MQGEQFFLFIGKVCARGGDSGYHDSFISRWEPVQACLYARTRLHCALHGMRGPCPFSACRQAGVMEGLARDERRAQHDRRVHVDGEPRKGTDGRTARVRWPN